MLPSWVGWGRKTARRAVAATDVLATRTIVRIRVLSVIPTPLFFDPGLPWTPSRSRRPNSFHRNDGEFSWLKFSIHEHAFLHREAPESRRPSFHVVAPPLPHLSRLPRSSSLFIPSQDMLLRFVSGPSRAQWHMQNDVHEESFRGRNNSTSSTGRHLSH